MSLGKLVNSILILPFRYWLTQVVPDREPLWVLLLLYNSRLAAFNSSLGVSFTGKAKFLIGGPQLTL